jgi:hypothetical protein
MRDSGTPFGGRIRSIGRGQSCKESLIQDSEKRTFSGTTEWGRAAIDLDRLKRLFAYLSGEPASYPAEKKLFCYNNQGAWKRQREDTVGFQKLSMPQKA